MFSYRSYGYLVQETLKGRRRVASAGRCPKTLWLGVPLWTHHSGKAIPRLELPGKQTGAGFSPTSMNIIVAFLSRSGEMKAQTA